MMLALHVLNTCSKICAIVLILINVSSSATISETFSAVNRTNNSAVKHVPRYRISSTYQSTGKNIETIPVYKLIQQKNLTVDHTELIKASWPMKIINCIRSRNIIQCMKIFLLQRTENALERINTNQLSKTNISWFDDILTLQNDSTVNFSKYENLTNAALNEQIIATLFQIYDERLIKFQLLPGVSFQIVPKEGENTFDLAVRFNQDVNARGMKMKDMMPMLMIPSVISTTFLPLMLPGIKMMVMFVMMINQMAFSMSLMSLIRGLIFDPRKEDEIVYVNKGYHNEKKHHHHPPFFPPSGSGGGGIGPHEESIHVGDASQVTITKQEPPIIVNNLPDDFLPQQQNFVNHQFIRPHFVNQQQRVVRPINPHIQQMIQPNIIERPAEIQIHQLTTAGIQQSPQHIAPIHHIPADAVPPGHYETPLPQREQTVFVHQQHAIDPEIVHYPQSDIHSNVIQQHQSHGLDTGLFAEPIGHEQKLLVHEDWRD